MGSQLVEQAKGSETVEAAVAKIEHRKNSRRPLSLTISSCGLELMEIGKVSVCTVDICAAWHVYLP